VEYYAIRGKLGKNFEVYSSEIIGVLLITFHHPNGVAQNLNLELYKKTQPGWLVMGKKSTSGLILGVVIH